MAEMKKYLDTTALGALVDKIKEEDAKVLAAAKKHADDLATNYDVAGAAATVQGNLDTYIASNDAALALKADKTELEAEVTRAKAAEEANTALITAIKDGDNLDSFKDVETELAKLQVKGDYAVNGHKHVMADITDLQAALDLKANKSDVEGALALKADKTEVEALAAKVGTVADDTTVVAMIEAVDGKADDNADAIEVLEGKVQDLIEGTYDDTEVRGLIKDNADAIDALEKVHADDKAALEAEDARIAGLVSAEAERAAGVEAGLEERLVEVETFFKTAEGQTIDEALDTLVELQTYLSGEGAAADQMVKDIAANKKAIEDHVALDHDFAAADATLKSELEGKIALKADASVVEAMDTAYKAADEALDARLDVLEAIDHDAYVAADTALENKLNAEIAKKADATALEAAVEALEGADSDLDERLQLVEAQLGDGESPVADLIAAAKQEAIDAATAAAALDASNKDAVVLAEAQKGIDAVQDALDAHIVEANALAGRVEVAEGEIDTLQSEMDAVELLAAANKAAHEANTAAIALKASQADLEAAVARIAKNETDIAANTSAINSFTAITSDEVNALFA